MFNIHISIERWKYNPVYEVYVSTKGRFKNKDKELITPAPVQKYITLILNGRVVRAHRLVLETFRPQSDMADLTVDHIDHNTRNNELSNLRWMTRKENCNDQVVLDFCESLKNLGAYEALRGVRMVSEVSKRKQKTTEKKTKKEKPKYSFDIEGHDLKMQPVKMTNLSEETVIKTICQLCHYKGDQKKLVRNTIVNLRNNKMCNTKKKFGLTITAKEAI